MFSLKRNPEGTSKPNNYLDHVNLVRDGVNHLDTFVKLHIFVRLLRIENELLDDSIYT